MTRKIAVVTGTRAEYGLLYWLMKEIQVDPELWLQLLVTGAHLSPEFGSTWKRIEEDGFAIDAKVEMLLSSDTPVAVVHFFRRFIFRTARRAEYISSAKIDRELGNYQQVSFKTTSVIDFTNNVAFMTRIFQ